VRYGIAGEPDESVDDLLGVVPGRAGVPEAQRGKPIGVDVFGAALEFGERCDRGAGLGGLGMVYLE
jgi:hypothetical protein